MAPVVRDSTGLQPGMIVTVEPGIYFSQFALTRVFLPDPKHAKYINKDVLAKYMPVGGVRIEDDILITPKGFENLTTAPKGEEALKIIRGDDSTSMSGVSKFVGSETGIASPCTPTVPAPTVSATGHVPTPTQLDAPEPKCILTSPVKQEDAASSETDFKGLMVAMIKSMDKLSHDMDMWNESAKVQSQDLLPRGVGPEGRLTQSVKSPRQVEYPYAEGNEVQSLNATYPPLPPSPPQQRRNVRFHSSA
jgi:hypothetical protein